MKEMAEPSSTTEVFGNANALDPLEVVMSIMDGRWNGG